MGLLFSFRNDNMFNVFIVTLKVFRLYFTRNDVIANSLFAWNVSLQKELSLL